MKGDREGESGKRKHFDSLPLRVCSRSTFCEPEVICSKGQKGSTETMTPLLQGSTKTADIAPPHSERPANVTSSTFKRTRSVYEDWIEHKHEVVEHQVTQ